MAEGVLVKDTHGSTIRIAPPLVISKEDLEIGLDRLRAVLSASWPVPVSVEPEGSEDDVGQEWRTRP
ncbi:Ornithine aminotransferase [Streptomyces badius]